MNLPTNQSTNRSIYRCTNLPTYKITNSQIYPPTKLSTYKSTNRPIYRCSNLPTYQSTNRPFCQRTNPPTYYPINQPIYLSTILPTNHTRSDNPTPSNICQSTNSKKSFAGAKSPQPVKIADFDWPISLSVYEQFGTTMCANRSFIVSRSPLSSRLPPADLELVFLLDLVACYLEHKVT
ncbi:adhesive plaque matrix protein [Plakobranchus ocellatus]|uniref:Adhesive plaque matrix protein n=1 Tax=Plakobranchus ocellatus TaxID=259542 RepID=A0AAV3YJT3_9GAST|nr:adhesive plaque matrix protein [Plakobranchus ocellatus]